MDPAGLRLDSVEGKAMLSNVGIGPHTKSGMTERHTARILEKFLQRLLTISTFNAIMKIQKGAAHGG